MKYLVTYAHPNPKSFNHAILEAVSANLKRRNEEFSVRDVYDLKFNPVLAGPDFIAMQSGKMPEDIAREQKIIKEADCHIFIHPIWWFSMPAMLKGYLDRVYSRGFAYDYTADGLKGLLSGKKVYVINTTGGDEATYNNYGFKDAIKKCVDGGTFGLCGMEVVEHKFFYSVPTSTDEQRKKMLEEIAGMNL